MKKSINNNLLRNNIDAMLHGMHMTLMAVVAVALAVIAGSCHNADLWDDVPGEIAEFINTYFPSSELQSVTHSGGTYHIRIDDGPGMTFDKSYDWLSVDGYGMPLPQVLLFDKLPPRLYNYISELEQLNGVFAITRDEGLYTATLMDTTVSYNVDTDTLKGLIDGSGADS